MSISREHIERILTANDLTRTDFHAGERNGYDALVDDLLDAIATQHDHPCADETDQPILTYTVADIVDTATSMEFTRAHLTDKFLDHAAELFVGGMGNGWYEIMEQAIDQAAHDIGIASTLTRKEG